MILLSHVPIYDEYQLRGIRPLTPSLCRDGHDSYTSYIHKTSLASIHIYSKEEEEEQIIKEMWGVMLQE